MTWVFANPTILGSAVCVADIQVTAGDDAHDCLRKLYPMDQNVLAGFAGDVWTGFQMLEALHHLIVCDKGEHGAPVEVERLCKRFSPLAKTTFEEQPREHKAGGCQVIIAGGSPAENALYGSRAFSARFSWPSFECDPIPRGEWRSIGSGADVAEYQAELESVVGPEGDGLIRMEAGWPGGYANAMSIAIMMSVADMPSMRGISKHFHVGIVTAHGFEFRTSDRTIFLPDEGQRRIEMPEVADTYVSLQSLLRRRYGAALPIALARW